MSYVMQHEEDLELTPEQKMLVSIIGQARADYLGYNSDLCNTQGERTKWRRGIVSLDSTKEEARQWAEANASEDDLGSLAWACSHLGLPVERAKRFVLGEGTDEKGFIFQLFGRASQFGR